MVLLSRPGANERVLVLTFKLLGEYVGFLGFQKAGKNVAQVQKSAISASSILLSLEVHNDKGDE